MNYLRRRTVWKMKHNLDLFPIQVKWISSGSSKIIYYPKNFFDDKLSIMFHFQLRSKVQAWSKLELKLLFFHLWDFLKIKVKNYFRKLFKKLKKIFGNFNKLSSLALIKDKNENQQVWSSLKCRHVLKPSHYTSIQINSRFKSTLINLLSLIRIIFYTIFFFHEKCSCRAYSRKLSDQKREVGKE